jgi:Tfp pilus assembly protein PilF
LLKGYEENNLKYLNKAINYCEQNARAYLVRAKCNEGKNNKLAENDYSIAIEYAPNLREIYQQRALFYRKIGRAREFEENYANYLSLKALGAKHTAELI